MSEIVISLLLLLGTFIILVGSIGLIRFPDVYNRIHATGKNATLGLVTLLIAGTIFFSIEFGLTLKLLLVIPFLFGTSPAGVFMIGQAAHATGTLLAPGTMRNDLARKAGSLTPKQ